MKRKKIPLILTVSLLALSLAACGKKDSGAGDGAGEGMTDETYEADAYSEEEYGDDDIEEGLQPPLRQERQPKSIQELAAGKPLLLDAARFDDFQADQDSLFQEFTFPFNRFGELDTDQAFTFRSDGTYYLERCYFGREHAIGLLNLGISGEAEEAVEDIVFEVSVSLNDSFEDGAELVEEYEDYDSLEMLEDRLFYKADEEDNWYTLYKVVEGTSAAGEAGKASAAEAAEALQELEDMGVDAGELLEEAEELARAEGEEAGAAASGKKKLELSHYEGTNVVEIAMRGSSGDVYDLEQVREVLLSIADCVTEDTGAPFLQDLVCVKDFNGFSIQDPSLLKDFRQTFNAEYNAYEFDVTLTVSQGEGEEEEEVLRLASETYSDPIYENAASYFQFGTTEVFGQEFYYGEKGAQPELYVAVDGSICHIYPGPNNSDALKETIEEYLQFD